MFAVIHATNGSIRRATFPASRTTGAYTNPPGHPAPSTHHIPSGSGLPFNEPPRSCHGLLHDQRRLSPHARTISSVCYVDQPADHHPASPTLAPPLSHAQSAPFHTDISPTIGIEHRATLPTSGWIGADCLPAPLEHRDAHLAPLKLRATFGVLLCADPAPHMAPFDDQSDQMTHAHPLSAPHDRCRLFCTPRSPSPEPSRS